MKKAFYYFQIRVYHARDPLFPEYDHSNTLFTSSVAFYRQWSYKYVDINIHVT